MPILSAGKLCAVTGGKFIKGKKDTKISGISKEYFNIKKGYLYFDVAKPKERDTRIRIAINSGAAAVVISEKKKYKPILDPHIVIISVPNVSNAFWKTVKYYRDMHSIPIVGVTGTSGKTTTCAMVTSIFRTKWKTLVTRGNLNLPDFVPSQIMLLNTNKYDAAVFEIGMHRKGQISKQSKIIQPKVGVITHIGEAHLEHVGNLANVILEKTAIANGIPADGCLVLNIDDPSTERINLSKFKGKVVYYGLIKKANYMASDLKIEKKGTFFKVLIDGMQHQFFIPTYGKHNVYNALAAIAVARFYGFSVNSIKKGLEKYPKPKMRLQVMRGIKNCVVIDDTFNANPNSVMAGLEVLSALADKKISIAVLGGMLEQGKYAIENHRKVGKKVEALNINWLITIGSLGKQIAKGVKSKKIKKWSFDSNQEAISFLRKNLPKNSIVFVKGSRGTRMQSIVKGIKANKKERQ